MTKYPDDNQVIAFRHDLADLLGTHKPKPEIALEVLLDAALALACSCRRVDLSRLDFRDGIIKAVTVTLDHHLDDPTLQRMAEQYNERSRKASIRRREFAQQLHSGRVLKDNPETP